MTDDALVAATLDIERHVGRAGWDQPARLFALVRTDALLAAEPTLADQLRDLPALPEGALTAIEQDEFRSSGDLVGDLERITWPDSVSGCALSVERVFVPPAVEADIPVDPDAAADFVARHPQRQDARVIVGVTRRGQTHGVVRLKAHPDDLLGGDGVVPGLARALASTLVDPLNP